MIGSIRDFPTNKIPFSQERTATSLDNASSAIEEAPSSQKSTIEIVETNGSRGNSGDNNRTNPFYHHQRKETEPLLPQTSGSPTPNRLIFGPQSYNSITEPEEATEGSIWRDVEGEAPKTTSWLNWCKEAEDAVLSIFQTPILPQQHIFTYLGSFWKKPSTVRSKGRYPQTSQPSQIVQQSLHNPYLREGLTNPDNTNCFINAPLQLLKIIYRQNLLPEISIQKLQQREHSYLHSFLQGELYNRSEEEVSEREKIVSEFLNDRPLKSPLPPPLTTEFKEKRTAALLTEVSTHFFQDSPLLSDVIQNGTATRQDDAIEALSYLLTGILAEPLLLIKKFTQLETGETRWQEEAGTYTLLPLHFSENYETTRIQECLDENLTSLTQLKWNEKNLNYTDASIENRLFGQAPKILFLQLVRTKIDPETGIPVKTDHYFENLHLPIVLLDNLERKVKYQPIGFLCHTNDSSNTLEEGHYMTYLQENEGNRFYLTKYDDQNVILTPANKEIPIIARNSIAILYRYLETTEESIKLATNPLTHPSLESKDFL